MNTRELEYMAELIRRDGDTTLQARLGIHDRHALYQSVMSIVRTAEKETCGATHFAVFRDPSAEDWLPAPAPQPEKFCCKAAIDGRCQGHGEAVPPAPDDAAGEKCVHEWYPKPYERGLYCNKCQADQTKGAK